MSCYIHGNQRYQDAHTVETVFNFMKAKLREEYEKYEDHPTGNIFTDKSDAIARYNKLQHIFNPQYYNSNGARIDGIDPNTEVDPIELEHETGVRIITYYNRTKGRTEYKVDVMKPNLEYIMIDGKVAFTQRKEDVWEFKSGIHNDPEWTVLNNEVNQSLRYDEHIVDSQKSVEGKTLKKAFELRQEELRKAYNEIKHQEKNVPASKGSELYRRKRFIEEEMARIKNFLFEIKDSHDFGHMIEWLNQELGILGKESERNSAVYGLMEQLEGEELYPGQHHTFIRQLEFIMNQWKAIMKTVQSHDTTIDKSVMKRVLKLAELKGENPNLNRAIDEIGDIKTIEEMKSRLSFSERKFPDIEDAIAGESPKDYHRLNYDLLVDIREVVRKRITQIENTIERKENEIVLRALFTNPEFKKGMVKLSGELSERFPDDGFYSTEEAEEIIDELSRQPDQIYNQNEEFTKFVRLISAVREDKYKIESQLRNQFLDITRSESIIGPVAQYLYDEGNIRYSVNTKRTSEEISEAEAKIKPVLERMRDEEGDVEEPGIKRVGEKSLYDVFLDDEVVEDMYGNKLRLYKHGLVKPYMDEYYSMKDKQEKSYYYSLRKADEGEKVSRKDAYRKFYEGILKHSQIIDFRRLPGIHKKAFEEVFQALDPNDSTGFEYTPDEDYYNQMLKLFGGRTEFMDTYVQNINEMLGEYARLKASLDTEVDLWENGDPERTIPGGRIGMSREKADMELMMNNPVYVLREIYDGVDSKAFNKALEGNTHSHMKYLMTVPRLKEARVKSTETSNFEVIETDKDTEYYNNKFTSIVKDDDLFEYYLFALGQISHLKDFMPVARMDEFTDFELPIINPISEDQVSKNLIKQLAGHTDSYVRSAHEAIVTRNIRKFERELVKDPFAQQIEQSTGGPDTSIVFKANTYGYYTESSLQHRLRNYFSFNVANENIDAKSPEGIEFARIEMLKYVNENKSYDINHVLRNYSQSAYNYYYRNQVAPILSYMRKFHKYKVVNINKNEEEPAVWKATLRKRQDEYERSMDWLLRIVMNARESQGTDRNLKAYRDSSLYTELLQYYGMPEEASRVAKALHKLFYKSALVIKYNKKDRELIKDIFRRLNADDGVSPEDALKFADSVFKGFYNKMNGTGILDNYFAFINFLFLGYRPKTAMRNLWEGLDSNYSEAIRGEKFHVSDWYRSLGLMLNSSVAFYTSIPRKFKRFENFGRTKTSNKIRYIMELYNVLQDATEDTNSFVLQDKSLQKLKTVNPFVFTSAAEYINQGQLALMHMMNKKVVGINGEEGNMWDMLDWNTKDNQIEIKPEFDTEENRALIFPDNDGKIGDEMVKMNHLIQETAVTIHGNYANTRNMMVKSHEFGAVMAMRSYLPEKVNYSYGGFRYDLSNQTIRAGNLKSVGYGAAIAMSTMIWLNNKATIGRKKRTSDTLASMLIGGMFIWSRAKSTPLYMNNVEGSRVRKGLMLIENELKGIGVMIKAHKALLEDHVMMRSRSNAGISGVNNEMEKANLKVFAWQSMKSSIILGLKLGLAQLLWRMIHQMLLPDRSKVNKSYLDRYRYKMENTFLTSGGDVGAYRTDMAGGTAIDPGGTAFAPIEHMIRQVLEYEGEYNNLLNAYGEHHWWMHPALFAKTATEMVVPIEFSRRLEQAGEWLIEKNTGRPIDFHEAYEFKDNRERDIWLNLAKYYDKGGVATGRAAKK